MSDWRDSFNSPATEDDTPAPDSVQHPALEALSVPLRKLSDFMHSGDENQNLSTVHKAGVQMFDMLGLGSAGNTLHRFAMGDSHRYTPEERTQANLDLLGSLPVGLEAGAVAKEGLRAALEGSLRADSKTALGMFTGQQAATSDLGALEQARLMAAGGKSPEEIHAATGWFKGKDGQWRQEIDDSTSAWKAAGYLRQQREPQFKSLEVVNKALDIKAEAQETGLPVEKVIRRYEQLGIPLPDAVKGLAHTETVENLNKFHEDIQAKLRAPLDAKLGDVLQHQRLFDAYPDLKEMPVHFDDLGPYIHGQVNTGPFPKMKLNNRNAFGPTGSEAHDTVLHEIQHQIQHEEGFDPGDSESRILGQNQEHVRAHAQYEDTVQAAIDIRNGNDLFRHLNPDAAELADDKTISTADLQDHLTLLQRRRPARIPPAKAREMYNAAGGEVEARATEKRRKLSQAERRSKYPMSDYDVPTDQILLRNQR